MMILVLLLVLSLLGSCMCELSVEEAMLRLPKLELHAHLHGSVRRSTLLELAALDNATAPLKLSLDKYDHGLPDKPFELFPLVHGIVKSKEIVKRIVQEMIADYQQQNCIYLEIRTTPRSLPDGTSLEEYLALVVGVIGEHNAVFGEQMLVKLIVGVDRGKKYSDAVEALELATKLMYYGTDKVIVAMDFSGNPLGGRFQDFAEVFTQAKQRGFNVTVHTAEMKGLSERADSDETAFILSFGPDRMGHMLYPMERHYDQVRPAICSDFSLISLILPDDCSCSCWTCPDDRDLPDDRLLPAGPAVIRRSPALPPSSLFTLSGISQH